MSHVSKKIKNKIYYTIIMSHHQNMLTLHAMSANLLSQIDQVHS